MANPFDVTKKLVAWGERAALHGLDLSTDLQRSIDNPAEMDRLVTAFNLTKPRSPWYQASSVNSLMECCFSESDFQSIPQLNPLPGYMTYFDPGWSIWRLRNEVKRHFPKKKLFFVQTGYDAQAFMSTEVLPRYRQLRLQPVNGSLNGAFDTALLETDEDVPSTRSVVMAIIIHSLITRRPFFHRYFLRCRETVNNCRICVGFFENSILFSDCPDWHRNEDTGLAAAKKE